MGTPPAWPERRRPHPEPRGAVGGQVEHRAPRRVLALPHRLPQHLVGKGLGHHMAHAGQRIGNRHAAGASVHLGHARGRHRERRDIQPREHVLGVPASPHIGHHERGVHQHQRRVGADRLQDLRIRAAHPHP